MSKKSSFASQFKGGYYPQEPSDESTRVNGHEVDAPSQMRSRQSIAWGESSEARPGMVGKQSFGTKRGK